MEGQFHSDSGSYSASHEGYDAVSVQNPIASEHTWPLANEIEQLLGEDSEPDPLFFEEGWTLGLASAVENHRRRREGSAGRERQSRAFRELDNLGTLSFVQASEGLADFLPLARATAIAGCYDAGWLREPLEEPAARVKDRPPQACETFADACYSSQTMLYPMTRHRACLLLGVTTASTGKQIKAAYRRMVSQWHPDRLECRSEEVRRVATEQMAAINEAYFLLRSDLLLESA